MYHRLLGRVDGLLSATLIVLVGVMLVPVTLQIITRYTPFLPPQLWTEEVARFCLVWAIMIGAAIGVREKAHFDIDLLPEPRTARSKAASLLVVDLAILVFACLFLWAGWQVFADGRNEISEMTEMAMGWFYVVFPLSAGCWIAYQLGHIQDALTVLFDKQGF